MTNDQARAALLLIGNELLSGKLSDLNGPYATRRLRELGIILTEMRVVADDTALIAQAVRELSRRNTFVITSGGIGPTHDDLTLDAISAAFDAPREMRPKLEAAIRARFYDDPQRADVWVEMARLPRGCELVRHDGSPWPVYKMQNVYALPGVPHHFERQFEGCVARYRATDQLALATLYLQTDEGRVSDVLREAQSRFDGVTIGSYPEVDGRTHSTRITVEAWDDRPAVEDAVTWLQGALPTDVVVALRWDDPTLLSQVDEAVS